MQPDSHLPLSAKRLKASKEALWERARAGSVGGFAWEYTHLVDSYFEERILELGQRKFAYALVAVGGYGRGRLCPGSDIDVLLLFKRRIPKSAEPFIRDLLFPLWDLNLDLGHGVRTIGDCVSLSRKDFQVLASLLDARPLAGDAEVFEGFRSAFDKKVLSRRGDRFAQSLREHNLTRAEKYGDATGLLEPEIKNGLGGLRDGQQVKWLTRFLKADGRKSVFLPEELARLRDDQAFLNRVRTALHLSAGRKNDRLFFDLQPPTARLMGFVAADGTPEDAGLGVEFFLSRLHQAMTRIKAMREALFREGYPEPVSCVPAVGAENIGVSPAGLFFKREEDVTPEHVLNLFVQSAHCGLPPSWGARRIIRRSPERFAGPLADRPETLDALVEIFMASGGDVACNGLLETRLLPALFPEFGNVEHLIQFNDYHVHPVGRHTLSVIAKLSGFLRDREGWAGEIAARLSHPKRLVLAGFFHDLGKGGGSHSSKGAAIAREVLARYGCDRETIEDVALLVQHHLLIPKAATRRDLTDERVAAEVAGVAGTLDRLDMLYLLSVADSMATGPRAWSSWTRSLFMELFHKVRNLLAHGPLAEPEAAERLVTVRNRILASDHGLDRDFVEAGCAAMPPRAFLALDEQTLVSQLRLVKRLWEAVAQDRIRKPSRIGGKGVNLIEAEPGKVENTYRLTIAALDRTGLFATIAGAITLHGMEILAVDIFTWKDGTAVDVFTVSRPPENLYIDEVWERIKRSIGYALTDKLDIAARLEDRRKSPLHKTRKGPRLKPIVSVDNLASDFYTVIEVAATNRSGFLYATARVLARYNLSIHVAQITTIKGRVADIFHVRDENGQKLTDSERIESLRKDLAKAAARG